MEVDEYQSEESEESDQGELLDSSENERVEELLNREYEVEEERQRLYDFPGSTHVNREFSDTSNDKDKPSRGRNNPYHFKMSDTENSEKPHVNTAIGNSATKQIAKITHGNTTRRMIK